MLPKMEQSSTKRILVYFAFISTLLPSHYEALSVRLQGSEGIYLVNPNKLTRTEAQLACKEEGRISGSPAELVNPSTQTKDSDLNKKLLEHYESKQTDAERNDLGNLWIGGYEESATSGKPDYPVWRWLEGLKEVYGQGCFEDDFRADRRDLITLYTFRDTVDSSTGTTQPMWVSDCTDHCRSKNYAYAGVQAGHLCYCDDTYGSLGVTSGCTIECTASVAARPVNREYCGGSYRNYIYKLKDAAYSNWGFAQPNNFDDYQTCGALESRSKWKMGDEKCFSTYYYICQVSSSDPGCQSSNFRYEMTDGKCLYYGTETRFNWFNARSKCIESGGDLVTINDEQMFIKIRTKLNTFQLVSTKVWIGLIGRLWSWEDGTSFIYTHWDPIEPDQNNGNCIVYKYSNDKRNYWWVDQDCGTKLPSVCYMKLYTDPSTTTVTASSFSTTDTTIRLTTTSNSSVTDAPTTPVGGPGSVTTQAGSGGTGGGTGGGTPDTGASTAGDGSLSQLEIIVIAILAVVLVIVIIIITVLCCKTNGCKGVDNKKNQIAPEKVTDLRNQVFIPFGDYYGNYGRSEYDSYSRPSSGEQILNPSRLASRGYRQDSYESDREDNFKPAKRGIAPDDPYESRRDKPHKPSGYAMGYGQDDQDGIYKPTGLSRMGSLGDEGTLEKKKKKKKKAKKYESGQFSGKHAYKELTPLDGSR